MMNRQGLCGAARASAMGASAMGASAMGAGIVLASLWLLGCGSSTPSARDGAVNTREAQAIDIGQSPRDAQGDLDGSQGSDQGSDPGVDCPGGWCAASAGEFKMGSPTGESCRNTTDPEDERRHTVALRSPFEMGQHEVTRGELKQVLGVDKLPVIDWVRLWAKHTCHAECYDSNDRETCNADCPVTKVSWHLAVAYCNQLTLRQMQESCQICVGQSCRPVDPALCQCYECKEVGATFTCTTRPEYQGSNIYSCPGYRLPTEAEWEYAYRAGTTQALYNGPIGDCEGVAEDATTEIGWYKLNAYQTVDEPNLFISLRPGKELAPNAFGIHDLAGNLSEWCHSWYDAYPDAAKVENPNPLNDDGTLLKRVVRGGYYDSPASDLRGASRKAHTPTDALDQLGFRCARAVF